MKTRRSRFQGKPCPPELDKTRCENARNIFDTWEVDYKWTEAQHLLGLEFAAEHYKPMKSDAELEEAACKVARPGGSPADSHSAAATSK